MNSYRTSYLGCVHSEEIAKQFGDEIRQLVLNGRISDPKVIQDQLHNYYVYCFVETMLPIITADLRNRIAKYNSLGRPRYKSVNTPKVREKVVYQP